MTTRFGSFRIRRQRGVVTVAGRQFVRDFWVGMVTTGEEHDLAEATPRFLTKRALIAHLTETEKP